MRRAWRSFQSTLNVSWLPTPAHFSPYRPIRPLTQEKEHDGRSVVSRRKRLVLLVAIAIAIIIATIKLTHRRRPRWQDLQPSSDDSDSPNRDMNYDPLPWRAYCSLPDISRPPELVPGAKLDEEDFRTYLRSFPPDNLDELPPAGMFIGVISRFSNKERRDLIRGTFASHPRSRNGAGVGDGGVGTSRSIVRFIIGQPEPEWRARVEHEMQLYNDIVMLPIKENMNEGKSYAYFKWAAENAWVPPLYHNIATDFGHDFLPENNPNTAQRTQKPPKLAPHDSPIAWANVAGGQDNAQPWVRPDFIVKMDDDAFLMIAELESRLRVELHRPANQPDPLIFWGYLLSDRFLAGEIYALSYKLVQWIPTDPVVETLVEGAEDKLTSRWMRELHPQAAKIRWVTERCWVYDHPRAPSTYAHGILFPSEVRRVRDNMNWPGGRTAPGDFLSSPSATNFGRHIIPRSWSLSSTTSYGMEYQPPAKDLSPLETAESLVEGSLISKLAREDNELTTAEAWAKREGRRTRYLGKRVGGTVAVHWAKEVSWFDEITLALLYGDEEVW